MIKWEMETFNSFKKDRTSSTTPIMERVLLFLNTNDVSDFKITSDCSNSWEYANTIYLFYRKGK